MVLVKHSAAPAPAMPCVELGERSPAPSRPPGRRKMSFPSGQSARRCHNGASVPSPARAPLSRKKRWKTGALRWHTSNKVSTTPSGISLPRLRAAIGLAKMTQIHLFVIPIRHHASGIPGPGSGHPRINPVKLLVSLRRSPGVMIAGVDHQLATGQLLPSPSTSIR